MARRGSSRGPRTLINVQCALRRRRILGPRRLGGGGVPHGHHGRALLVHWNGTSWTRVAAPDLSADGSELIGVGSTSPGNVWAVGAFRSGAGLRTLALHCC